MMPHRTAELPAIDENTPTYKVIFANNAGSSPKVFTGRITDSMTVQDALAESGASDKYRGMLIDLARKVPEKDEILRLPVVYDSDARHVIDAQNYAIHPGDEILIRRDNPGALEAVFKSFGTSPSALY